MRTEQAIGLALASTSLLLGPFAWSIYRDARRKVATWVPAQAEVVSGRVIPYRYRGSSGAKLMQTGYRAQYQVRYTVGEATHFGEITGRGVHADEQAARRELELVGPGSRIGVYANPEKPSELTRDVAFHQVAFIPAAIVGGIAAISLLVGAGIFLKSLV